MSRWIGLALVVLAATAAAIYVATSEYRVERPGPAHAADTRPSRVFQSTEAPAKSGSPTSEPSAAAAPSTPGRITGKVVDAEGRPTRATVVVIGDEERFTFTRSVEAAEDGMFSLDLPEGDYWVHAEGDGRVSLSDSACVREWLSGSDSLELALGRTGRVSGFVEDPDERRLSGARVLLRSPPYDLDAIYWGNERLPSPEPVAMVCTDASGRFEAACPIGCVYVQADAEGLASATASVELTEGGYVQADLLEDVRIELPAQR